MNRQFETIALSSRLAHVAAPLMILANAVYFAVLTFETPMRVTGLTFVAAIAVACGSILWWELRIPRFVVFTDGVCQLRSFGGSIKIRDGDLESLEAGLLTRLYRGAAPSRVVLRFRGGSRVLYTNFREYPQFVEELRARNPSAEIPVPRKLSVRRAV